VIVGLMVGLFALRREMVLYFCKGEKRPPGRKRGFKFPCGGGMGCATILQLSA